MKRWRWSLAFGLCVACGDKETADTGVDSTGGVVSETVTTTTPTVTTTTPVFAPTEGHWLITDGTLVNDTCEYDFGDMPDATKESGFTLSATGGEAYDLLLDDAERPFVCTLTDQTLLCEPSEGTEPVDDFAMEITSLTTVDAEFADADNVVTSFSIEIDCIGDDCWLAEAHTGVVFPCGLDFTMDAVAE